MDDFFKKKLKLISENVREQSEKIGHWQRLLETKCKWQK